MLIIEWIELFPAFGGTESYFWWGSGSFVPLYLLENMGTVWTLMFLHKRPLLFRVRVVPSGAW